MKRIIIAALILLGTVAVYARDKAEPAYKTPLSKYSKEWDNPKYRACNTAANTPYLSDREKEIIYVLNMARMNPQLFCKTVLPHAHQISYFIDTANEVYYKTLVQEMKVLKPQPILKPDSACYYSALCHVNTSGPLGYVGHDRQSDECKKAKTYGGECCQYGVSEPLAIVLNLLVDENVPSLGHRHICLAGYTKMSVAYGKHKGYGSMAVLDFKY